MTGAGANGGPPLAGAADFTGTQYQGMNAIEGSFALSFGFEIAVNTAGEFFKNLAGVGLGYANVYASQIGSLIGGTVPAQMFILLHELAHYFLANGFIMNDPTKAQQAANNDMIWKNCSQTIQGLGLGTGIV